MQSGKKLLIIAEDVEGEALVYPDRQQAPRHLQLSLPSRLRASATDERKCSRISLFSPAAR